MTERATQATAPARVPLHSPPLVRLLAALDDTGALPGVARPQASVGERLGQWLDWTDAIALSQTLNQVPPPPAHPVPAAHAAQRASTALARVRADCSRAILQDPVFQPDQRASADLGDIRRAAQARQRGMAAAIAPLRAQLRGLLAVRSAPLAHLAALDATLDAALAERERHSLGSVVAQLEQQFQQGQQAGADHWRDAFFQSMQQLLLAELDLRLQPVQGLADALGEALGEAA